MKRDHASQAVSRESAGECVWCGTASTLSVAHPVLCPQCLPGALAEIQRRLDPDAWADAPRVIRFARPTED